MGKLLTYMIIMMGISTLFYFAGFIENTSSSLLLDLAFNPEQIKDRDIGVKTLGILQLVGLGGIVLIGALTGNLDLVMIGSFTVLVFNLGWDFLTVATKVYSTYPILTPFFGIFFVGFIITIVEFWRGRD